MNQLYTLLSFNLLFRVRVTFFVAVVEAYWVTAAYRKDATNMALYSVGLPLLFSKKYATAIIQCYLVLRRTTVRTVRSTYAKTLFV